MPPPPPIELGVEPGRIGGARRNRSVSPGEDVAPGAALPAGTAERHRRADEHARRTRDGEAAIAAAAADRLCDNAAGAIAGCTDRRRGDGRGGVAGGVRIQANIAGAATRTALATDCERAKRTAAYRKAAIATPAADRLHDDCRRIMSEGRDRSAIGQDDGVAVARHAAGAAQRYRPDQRAAAIAAAAADRLRENPRRGRSAGAVEPGEDVAAVGDCHSAGVGARAACAAIGEEAARGAAIAAAAADRLRENARRARSAGLKKPLVRQADGAALCRARAVAAQREQASGIGAVAATATDRLTLDGVGAEPERCNRSAIEDLNVPAGAAAGTAAAKRDCADDGPGAAAAATDRLGKNALGELTFRRYGAIGVDDDLTAGASRAAVAAARIEQAEPARAAAAAAAETVGRDPVGEVAESDDRSARHGIDLGLSGLAGAAAAAADKNQPAAIARTAAVPPLADRRDPDIALSGRCDGAGVEAGSCRTAKAAQPAIACAPANAVKAAAVAAVARLALGQDPAEVSVRHNPGEIDRRRSAVSTVSAIAGGTGDIAVAAAAAVRPARQTDDGDIWTAGADGDRAGCRCGDLDGHIRPRMSGRAARRRAGDAGAERIAVDVGFGAATLRSVGIGGDRALVGDRAGKGGVGAVGRHRARALQPNKAGPVAGVKDVKGIDSRIGVEIDRWGKIAAAVFRRAGLRALPHRGCGIQKHYCANHQRPRRGPNRR